MTDLHEQMSPLAPHPCRPVAVRLVRIVSTQFDADHVVVELSGVVDPDGVAYLQQRVDGRLLGGVRFVLVDLSGIPELPPAAGAVLASGNTRLHGRDGWLRTVGGSQRSVEHEVSLSELFDMYRSVR